MASGILRVPASASPGRASFFRRWFILCVSIVRHVKEKKIKKSHFCIANPNAIWYNHLRNSGYVIPFSRKELVMPKNEKMFGRVLACYSAFADTRHFALVRRGSVDYTVSVSPSFADGNASHIWFKLFRDGSYRHVANPR